MNLYVRTAVREVAPSEFNYIIEVADVADFSNILVGTSVNDSSLNSMALEAIDTGTLVTQIDTPLGVASDPSPVLPIGCYSMFYDGNSAPVGFAPLFETVNLLPSGGVGFVAQGDTVYIDLKQTAPQSNWTSAPCCVHPNARVRTPTGFTRIENITSGDIVINHKGENVEVLYNIEHSTPTGNFIKIEKDAFSKNTPDGNLLMTKGHPLLYKGRIMDLEQMIYEGKANEVTVSPVRVFTLCTENQEWIVTQNVPVSTFSHEYWSKFSKENNCSWARK